MNDKSISKPINCEIWEVVFPARCRSEYDWITGEAYPLIRWQVVYVTLACDDGL